MKYKVLVLVFILVFTIPAMAQDWTKNEDGDIEFNCDVVKDMVDQFGTEDFARTKGQTVDAASFFDELVDCSAEEVVEETTATGDVLFNVIVVGNVNLRGCAGTNCDIVGQAADKSVLSVIKEVDDWYQVEFDGKDAFIASWLTQRGPAAIIETSERYVIEENGCIVFPDVKRGDNDVTVIISGDRQDDMTVDLYRPNEQYALKVNAQYDKTFTDTKEPYIHQFYRWNVSFPTGLYYIEVTLDDTVTRVGWNLAERGDYSIYVLCS